MVANQGTPVPKLLVDSQHAQEITEAVAAFMEKDIQSSQCRWFPECHQKLLSHAVLCQPRQTIKRSDSAKHVPCMPETKHLNFIFVSGNELKTYFHNCIELPDCCFFIQLCQVVKKNVKQTKSDLVESNQFEKSESIPSPTVLASKYMW